MLSLSVFHVFSAIGSFQSWGLLVPAMIQSWGQLVVV
jgi:hypothetical protein